MTEVLKMLLEAGGRGQLFQARFHSFSLYGLTITLYLFVPAVNWLTGGFVYTTLSLNRLTRRLQTIRQKKLTNEQASNSDTKQRKMY